MMTNRISFLFIAFLALLISSTALAGSSVELRLQDGSKWRGETGTTIQITFMQQSVEVTMEGNLLQVASLYIQVNGTLAGKRVKKTIFKSDIITIKTIDEGGAIEPETESDTPKKRGPSNSDDTNNSDKDDDSPGVFVLPLEGTVGTFLRHEEIVEIGKHADEFGPGQIIVLKISSNGGLVVESEEIVDTIFELRKRHRVVAWIHKALSAGCSTAMCCEEVYFMTEGVAGSVTTISGGSAIQGDEQELHIQSMVDLALRAGYSEHIARSMKASRFLCSYDKDPETGEVTFYDDLSGEFLLSDENSNLCFNSSNAFHCGFADGIADTEEELAELLQLPKWREIDDYGQRIHDEWSKLVERCEDEVPKLLARLSYKNASGSAQQRIGTTISIYKQLIRWHDRCLWPCRLMGVPEPEILEREIEELRKQLADMKRGGG